jgi:hypothetical protein
VALWIAAAVYFKIQDSKGWRGWTLFSWSCEHTNLTSGKMSFEAMCVRMASDPMEVPCVKLTWSQNYAFYAAIAVAVLEVFSLLLFGLALRKVKMELAQYSKITVERR